MWNSILGALAILGMVVVLRTAPELVDAWCDRIRYGVQSPAADLDEDAEEEPEPVRPAAATPKAAAKPAAAAPKAAAKTAAPLNGSVRATA